MSRTIIANARIVTCDDANSVLGSATVSMDGGRITAVSTAPIEPDPGDVVIDARGGIVLPGLVNAHTHLAMTLLRGVADGTDLDSFLAKLLPIEGALVNADVVVTGTELACVELLRSGCTAALDMYFFPGSAGAAAARVGLAVHTGPVFIEFPGPDDLVWSARLAWSRRYLQDQHADARWVCPHSTYLLSEEQLREVAALADETGARVHVHAAETMAELAQVAARHDGRTPVQVLADVGLLHDRTVLAHAVHVTDHDIDLIAAAGAHVSHNPASNAKLASGLAPVRNMLDAGVNVALGTDGASSANDLDLWMAMRLASFLPSIMHGNPGEITADDVVRMATINGAKALGCGSTHGSIEVGKVADLVVLDGRSAAITPSYDPTSTLAFSMSRAEVSHVFAAGAHVVDAGCVVTVPADLHDRVAVLAERVSALRQAGGGS